MVSTRQTASSHGNRRVLWLSAPWPLPTPRHSQRGVLLRSVSVVSAAVTTYLPFSATSIPERGPCLPSGALTVDDSSLTTRANVHSGLAAGARYGTAAQLDTGSPKSFNHCGSGGTTESLRRRDRHVRTGRGSSFMGRLRYFRHPLDSSTCIRHRITIVRLLRGSSPTGTLTVWVCLIPPGTVQHPTPPWAGLLAAIRATLVRHPSPPAPQTNAWRAFSLSPQPQRSRRLHSRRLFDERHLPPSIPWCSRDIALVHPGSRRGQLGARITRFSGHRGLHGQSTCFPAITSFQTRQFSSPAGTRQVHPLRARRPPWNLFFPIG